MRWGAIALAGLVAACNGTGVDIDVFVPSGVTVDRVELWVAYDGCSDCPNGVAWTQDARADGKIVYLRDEKLIEAKRLGERWVLHLDVVPGNEDPYTIAFVGFAGQQVTAIKVVEGVHISTSDVAIWQVYLHPADMATTAVKVAPPNVDRVYRGHVWARQPTVDIAEPTGCLVYQKWDGTTWQTEYLVPKTDPDCDGFLPDKECNAFWYQYKAQAAYCVTDTLLVPTGCLLGNANCEDGITSNASCTADTRSSVPACLPAGFCQYCGDHVPVDDCIASAIVQGDLADTTVHYHCELDPSANGTTPCQDYHVQLQLPMPGAGSNTTCGAPLMHYIDKPFTEGQNALVYSSGSGQLKLEVQLADQFATPCLYNLFWREGSTDNFGPDGITFLLEVSYDNSTRAFYPIIVSDTTTPVSCMTVPPVGKQCYRAGPDVDVVENCVNGQI